METAAAASVVVRALAVAAAEATEAGCVEDKAKAEAMVEAAVPVARHPGAWADMLAAMDWEELATVAEEGRRTRMHRYDANQLVGKWCMLLVRS